MQWSPAPPLPDSKGYPQSIFFSQSEGFQGVQYTHLLTQCDVFFFFFFFFFSLLKLSVAWLLGCTFLIPLFSKNKKLSKYAFHYVNIPCKELRETVLRIKGFAGYTWFFFHPKQRLCVLLWTASMMRFQISSQNLSLDHK